MSHEKTLQDYTRIVDNAVASYFKSYRMEYGYHPFMKKVHGQLEEYVLRKGKRLASASTLITYKGYSGKLDANIKEVSVGVELYRHSILAHDDLADRDDFRRGGEALHKLHDGRLGEAVAIFGGNLLYALSINVFMDSRFDAALKQRVIELFTEEYAAVNESQILDVYFEGISPGEKEWYSMAARRAASLFKATILAGAIFGGANDDEREVLAEAAENIGYAFDIQDDIIGTFASEKQYGRAIGGDIALHKKPLHVVYALEKSTKKQAAMLMSDDVEIAKEVIRATGGLERAKMRSKEHAVKAKRLLAKTAMDDEAKEFFSGFIDYVSESLEWYA